MGKRAGARALVLSFVAATSLAFGCFDFGALQGGTDLPEAGVDAAGPGFTISVPPTLSIEQGKSSNVTIAITRSGGFDGAVNLVVSGMPAGVTANPLVVAAGAASGTLTLVVDGSAAQSVSHLSLYGLAVDKSVNANTETDLTVRGPPGSLDTLFGVNGFASDPFPSGFDPLGMTLDEHGRIVVLGGEGYVIFGEPEGGLEAELTMLRLSPDGKLDGTFGQGGIVHEDFGHTDQSYAFGGVFALDSGSIMTTGSIGPVTALSRFAGDGAVDNSFSP
ncbi:MAG TPA: hypothetical protein VF407_04615, partial [Polyangiaceae bacterium]